MNIITKEQLAFFALSLWHKMSTDKLHPHLKLNFEIYQRAIKKAQDFNLHIPRFTKKNEVRKLAFQLNSALGNPKGWKEVNWMILAYLLIFTSQVDRNHKKNIKTGKRWINIEAHIFAIKYAKSINSSHDPVILAFLKQDEAKKLSTSLDKVGAGEDYPKIVKETFLSPHGLRESLRCLMEYDERDKGIPPATKEVVTSGAKFHSSKWNKERDPEASLIRIRGVIHEKRTRELLLIHLTEARPRTEQRLLTKVTQRKSFVTSISSSFRFTALDPAFAQFVVMSVFISVFLTCLSITPQNSFSIGIAWWYFQFGALVSALIILSSPFILGTTDETRIDISSNFGFIGIFLILLWLLNKDTYLLGIAWWHALLGSLCCGSVILFIGAPIKSTMTKQKLTISF